MQTYSKFRPTSYDRTGLNLPDQQNWLVAPCGRNRDSTLPARCNFKAQQERLRKADPDGEDYEAHQFNHWACGWVEIVIVRPGSAAADEAEKIEGELENYPLLDETAFHEEEAKEADEAWEGMGLREKIRLCKRRGLSFLRARSKGIPEGLEATDLI
jgi:hypothetical protein